VKALQRSQACPILSHSDVRHCRCTLIPSVMVRRQAGAYPAVVAVPGAPGDRHSLVRQPQGQEPALGHGTPLLPLRDASSASCGLLQLTQLDSLVAVHHHYDRRRSIYCAPHAVQRRHGMTESHTPCAFEITSARLRRCATRGSYRTRSTSQCASRGTAAGRRCGLMSAVSVPR